MIFASKRNFEAIKMLDKMNDNIETRDIYKFNLNLYKFPIRNSSEDIKKSMD